MKAAGAAAGVASEFAIETIELAKRYRGATALADLTLTVRRGEIFGFLGPNGAGKTTAVKVLLGLTRPTSGAAEVLGAPLGDHQTRRRVGYLPELFRYQEWLSAREVLAFHSRLLGCPRPSRHDEAERVLEIVGLSARARERVGTYSKGMQQRLGLAVALLGRPSLVFLDEPTSALDPLGRHDVRILIEKLRSGGTTVFLNSHLLTEVERVCDRIAVIDHGRVIAAGPLTELLGTASMIRLHLGTLGSGGASVLARVGARLESEAPANGTPAWYVVEDAPGRRVPDIVRELVALGIDVHAVEPQRATLEDRFREILTADRK